MISSKVELQFKIYVLVTFLSNIQFHQSFLSSYPESLIIPAMLDISENKARIAICMKLLSQQIDNEP